MDISSFLMIGNKESGKTTSMISAYGKLSHHGVNGFRIESPDKATMSEFNSMYDDLKNGDYPLATQKRSCYSFDLYYKGTVVHKFEWKDFYGGIINETVTENSSILKDDMLSSSGMMIFFDAEKLYNNSIDTKVRRIIHLISQNFRSIEKPYFITIVVTKFDLLSDFQRNDTEKWLYPLNPFLNAINSSEYINVQIIPTSSTSCGFVNVEIPILYLLHGTMYYYCKWKSEELEKGIQTFKEYDSNAGFLDDVISTVFGAPTYRELAQQKANELNPQIDFYNQVLNSLKSLESYFENIDLMENFKKIKNINNKYNF